ncbi:MAG: hypothetical protein R2828_34575 [Saprospiraceae bacterium]
MKKDWLEEKLYEGLSDYASPMDMEGSWNRLALRRKREKKRLFLWWLVGVSSILLLGMATFWALSPASQQKQVALSFLAIPQVPTTPASSATIPAPIVVGKQDGNSQKVSSKKAIAGVTPPVTKAPAPANLGQLSLPAPVPFSPGKEAQPTTIFMEEPAIGTLRPMLLPIEYLRLYPQQESKTLQAKLTPLALSIPTPKKQKQDGWWLGASFTLGQYKRQLKAAPEDSLRLGLVARREQSEQPLEAWSFALDLRKQLSKHLFIQSGLRHQLSFEKFTDHYERTFPKTLENQVTQIIQRADGSTTEIREDIEVKVTETVTSIFYNRQQVTEIPFLIGLSQAINKETGLNLGIGGSWAFLQQRQGQVHLNATSIGTYEPLSQTGYRKTNLWSIQAQMEVYQRLSPGIQAFVGGQVKAYSNTASASTYFTEQQQFFNAVLGFRVRLDWHD